MCRVSLGLPPAAFAAAIPNNWGREVGELVTAMWRDQAAMVSTISAAQLLHFQSDAFINHSHSDLSSIRLEGSILMARQAVLAIQLSARKLTIAIFSDDRLPC